MTGAGVGPLAGAAEPPDFAHEVLPILRERCAECHTDGTYKGSLSMDTRAALLGGDGIVVPGDPQAGEFYYRITTDDEDDRMPPEGDPLTPAEVAVLERWLAADVPWEPGFTFRSSQWKAPVAPRRPELPAGGEADHPVDRIVGAYFASHDVVPPGPVDDAVFLRRVSLDLVGLLPTPEEWDAFLADPDPHKRDRVVDDLLGRDRAYADHWLSFWNDLLRNDYVGTGYIDGGRKPITGWLYASLRDNKPFDRFVHELVDATPESEGFIRGIQWRGNVNASQRREVQFAQTLSQVFLGENMKCASCHDSFIDDWKLEDAYGLAAIIAEGPLEIHRCDQPTGKMARPRFLFPELGEIDAEAPPAERLRQTADLMTSPENGRLSRTIVNRLWRRLMGHALVEPVDSMGNRPWNEDLLDWLAVDLAEHGWDLRHTLARIATSRAYQSASVPPHDGPEDDYVFRGPVARRMTAEQFLDAVWRITGTTPPASEAAVPADLLAAPPAAPADGEESAPDATRAESTAASVAAARWIWSAADPGNRPAGESAVLRRHLELPEAPAHAFAAVTCDNAYELHVNGRRVASDDDWMDVERIPLDGFLVAGANEIRVTGRNLGDAPNPAGLLAVVRIELADGRVRDLVTDRRWEAEIDGQWRPAAEVGPATQWGPDAATRLAARLGPDGGPSDEPVRASLVEATALMRALGRPNREQVVTTRPAELSTLEALELNNGREFVDLLERGAQRLVGAARNQGTEALVDELYQAALSRNPTPEEARIAHEIAGDPVDPTGASDLLWTLFLLPEFQIIR